MKFKENETPTKLRGGYYTPPEIASFLTKWVTEAKPTGLLEPGCGDGVFIDAISQMAPPSLKSVLAFEIDASEAEKARDRARGLKGVAIDVRVQDFIRWCLTHMWEPGTFDGVLGNPPFIRYQYLDEQQQLQAKKLFDCLHLPFTMHTNAWVPFVIASINRLRGGGRLGMVVPSEILHVLHAQALRTFLTMQCSRTLVVDPDELWFNDLLQGVVLLLAEKRLPSSKSRGQVAILRTSSREFLSESPASLFRRAEFLEAEMLEGKWMRGLLTRNEREILDDLPRHPHIHRFSDLATVDVGIVTGANKFFLVSDSVVQQFGLSPWAYPMFGRSEHVPGVIYDKKTHAKNRRQDLPANFLWFSSLNPVRIPANVREYLRTGEAAGLHRRYKCRIRTPWYLVPSVSLAPVGMLKRCHDFPRLILNTAKAFTTDTAYRIRPSKVSASRLVSSFVNSLTALTAELEGRHYGGGVLELVPSEIERLLLPVPTEHHNGIRKLDQLIREGTPAERVLLIQDSSLLRGIGLKEAQCEELLLAWNRLRIRRQRNLAEKCSIGYDISRKNVPGVPSVAS
jgi:adenine-specific DNA methylase